MDLQCAVGKSAETPTPQHTQSVIYKLCESAHTDLSCVAERGIVAQTAELGVRALSCHAKYPFFCRCLELQFLGRSTPLSCCITAGFCCRIRQIHDMEVCYLLVRSSSCQLKAYCFGLLMFLSAQKTARLV